MSELGDLVEKLYTQSSTFNRNCVEMQYFRRMSPSKLEKLDKSLENIGKTLRKIRKTIQCQNT